MNTLNICVVVLYVLATILIIIGVIHGVVFWKILNRRILKIVDIIYIFLLLCSAGALVYAYPSVFN